MVECFHRQLKAAFKAYPNSTQWIEALPVFLLGIRTALKQDLGCSAPEMVYGTTLCLPGAFFNPQENDNLEPIDYVQNLKKLMQNLQTVSPRSNQHQLVCVPSDLLTQSHVFLRHDAYGNCYNPHMIMTAHPESLVLRRKIVQ